MNYEELALDAAKNIGFMYAGDDQESCANIIEQALATMRCRTIDECADFLRAEAQREGNDTSSYTLMRAANAIAGIRSIPASDGARDG